MEDSEIEPTKKDYAVCIFGQLRGVKSVVSKFYDNLIDILDADLYIVSQKTYTDIDNDIDLFDKNVVSKVLYDPPKDIESMFINYSRLLKHDNYICNASLQVFLNFYMISEKFGDIFENNYRYVIMTRSDFYHLFPFPNILHLDNTDDTFWCYDVNDYYGVNATLMCVPSNYIKCYLNAFKSFLDDSNNIKLLNSVPFNGVIHLNTEMYVKILFTSNKWSLGKLRSNAFISASSLQEITTWGAIMYDDTNKLYYKYETQYRDALLGLKEYNEELKKWTYHYDMNNNTKTILLS